MSHVSPYARRMLRASFDTLTLTALTGILAYQSLSLDRVAGSVPRTVLFVTAVLIALQWALDLRREAWRSQTAVADSARDPVQASSPIAALAWMIGLLALVVLLGTALGSAIFCLLFLRRRAREGWWLSTAYAFAVGAGLVLVFRWLLGARLYPGWLWLH